MSDLTERMRRRAETLEALSDPDLPPATIGTLAWKVEARLSMRGAARDSTQAADEIERLTRELAEAREALDDLLEAVTAQTQHGDRSLTITGPTANLKWLLDAEEAAARALKEKP